MTSHTTPSRTGRAAKSLAMALALAAMATTATPAVATTHRHHHRAAQSTGAPNRNGSGAFAQVGPFADVTSIDEARAAAIRDCSAKAQPLSNSSWQTAQFATYGTCMTEHGQMP